MSDLAEGRGLVRGRARSHTEALTPGGGRRITVCAPGGHPQGPASGLEGRDPSTIREGPTALPELLLGTRGTQNTWHYEWD